MNQCVKTGFVFRVIETGEVRNGDLFYIADLFQIRGVNPADASDYPLDAYVSNIVLSQRSGSTYKDSNLGISIINPSVEFQDHIRKWYPNLVGVIPGVEKNGETA
jgi:hypothetical protein